MTIRRWARQTALLAIGCCVLLLAGAACGEDERHGDGAGADTPSPAASPTAVPSHTPTVLPTSTTALPAVVEAAIARAAADAGTTPDGVELLGYTSTEWNNSALGCPEPGKFYQQVITPGYTVRVRLRDSGIEREYHTDLDSRVVTCDSP